MLRRLVQLFVVLPLAVLLIAFALANRHAVAVSFDPFGGQSELAVTIPLFVLVFIALLTGVLIGGVAAWLRQGKWRRQAKLEHREAARWRHRANEAIRRTSGEGGAMVPAGMREER